MRTALLAPLAAIVITGCVTDSTDLAVEESELAATERFPLLADLTYDVAKPVVGVRCFDAGGRFAFRVNSFMFAGSNGHPELYMVIFNRAFDFDVFDEIGAGTLDNAAGSSTVLFGTTPARISMPDSIVNTGLTFELDPTRTDARKITGRGTIAGVPGTWGCELFNRRAVSNASWDRVL